jgi:hypothetical protein
MIRPQYEQIKSPLCVGSQYGGPIDLIGNVMHMKFKPYFGRHNMERINGRILRPTFAAALRLRELYGFLDVKRRTGWWANT